jgi:hypothetical protein
LGILGYMDNKKKEDGGKRTVAGKVEIFDILEEDILRIAEKNKKTLLAKPIDPNLLAEFKKLKETK